MKGSAPLPSAPVTVKVGHPRLRVPSWWPEVLYGGGAVAVTLLLAVGFDPLLDLDVVLRDWVDAHRPPWFYWTLRGVNYLGQGTPLALLCFGIALVFARRTRSVRPVLPVLVAYPAVYLSIGGLKFTTHRPAPHYGGPEFFADPAQISYPSGHAVNSIVWYGLLALLLARHLPPVPVRVVRVVVAVGICFATTYLGFHWLTDTMTGLLIGLLINRLLRRVEWETISLPAFLGGWRRDAVW